MSKQVIIPQDKVFSTIYTNSLKTLIQLETILETQAEILSKLNSTTKDSELTRINKISDEKLKKIREQFEAIIK